MNNTTAQYGLFILLALAAHLPCHGQTTSDSMQQGQSPDYTIMKSEKTGDNNSSDTVRIIASNLPLARVTMQIEDQTGIPITLKGRASEEKVSVIAPKAKSVDEALSMITASNPSLMVKQTTASGKLAYEVWDKSEYEARARVIKVYQLHEARADYVEDLLMPILTPGTGSINADLRLNQIIVYDIPEIQAEIKNLIQELDQPLAERFFTLRHGSPSSMVLYLRQYCNLQSDQCVADEASRQIAVRGTTDTLKRAASLIEAFDVPAVSKADSKTTTVKQFKSTY